MTTLPVARPTNRHNRRATLRRRPASLTATTRRETA